MRSRAVKQALFDSYYGWSCIFDRGTMPPQKCSSTLKIFETIGAIAGFTPERLYDEHLAVPLALVPLPLLSTMPLAPGTITTMTALGALARTPWRVLVPRIHTHMYPFECAPTQTPGFHYNSPQVRLRENPMRRPVAWRFGFGVVRLCEVLVTVSLYHDEMYDALGREGRGDRPSGGNMEGKHTGSHWHANRGLA